MFKEKDYVVYNNNVCRIEEIREKRYRNLDYYFMHPIDDDTLNIEIPVDNKKLRKVITKEEANKLIEKIPYIEIINDNTKMIENTYKELMKTNNLEDLIKIIKTTYLRNNTRIKNGKKESEKDSNYFEMSEKRLYNELSIALNLSFKETKEYIINKVNNIDNK